MTRQESAQILALRALAWLAADDDRIAAFLAQTGMGAAELRAAAADPEVLAAVLDFLLADEDSLLGFCAETGLPPEEPMRARTALPGGDLPNWT